MGKAEAKPKAPAAVTPPPVNELNRELDVLLATEDNTVREEAGALLGRTAARVASERLAGRAPSGTQLYDHAEQVDGHTLRLSAAAPLRTLLSTPALPAELLEAIPEPKEGPGGRLVS